MLVVKTNRSRSVNCLPSGSAAIASWSGWSCSIWSMVTSCRSSSSWHVSDPRNDDFIPACVAVDRTRRNHNHRVGRDQLNRRDTGVRRWATMNRRGQTVAKLKRGLMCGILGNLGRNAARIHEEHESVIAIRAILPFVRINTFEEPLYE